MAAMAISMTVAEDASILSADKPKQLGTQFQWQPLPGCTTEGASGPITEILET